MERGQLDVQAAELIQRLTVATAFVERDIVSHQTQDGFNEFGGLKSGFVKIGLSPEACEPVSGMERIMEDGVATSIESNCTFPDHHIVTFRLDDVTPYLSHASG